MRQCIVLAKSLDTFDLAHKLRVAHYVLGRVMVGLKSLKK